MFPFGINKSKSEKSHSNIYINVKKHTEPLKMVYSYQLPTLASN